MPAYWLKPEDSVNVAWFEPLESLAARVAQDPDLPQINPDHFMYAARIDRKGFAPLHAYRHIATRKFLNIDERGYLWRYTASDKVGLQRYALFGGVREALAGADLSRGNLLVRHLRSLADGTAPTPPGWVEPESRPSEQESSEIAEVDLPVIEDDLVDAAYEDSTQSVSV